MRAMNLVDAQRAKLLPRIIVRHAKKAFALFSENIRREVNHVFAAVIVFMQFCFPAALLQVACVQRAREVSYLRARVVEVILARNIVACRLQDICQRAADDAAASVRYEQRSHGVRAHELDLHGFAAARFDIAELASRRPDGLDLLLQPGMLERQVDEARSRDGSRLQQPVILVADRKARRKSFGDLQWVHSHRSREFQRQAGGEVAMLRVLRPLYRDVFHFD